MENEHRGSTSKVEVVNWAGPVWVIGWLFTLGYAHLPFLKAVLALVLWPYYLGDALG